jgi:hypothetical protein
MIWVMSSDMAQTIQKYWFWYLFIRTLWYLFLGFLVFFSDQSKFSYKMQFKENLNTREMRKELIIPA